ncbi:MAG: hypothetical protein ACRYFX_25490 [Janthinobacterium lividum]
MVVELIPVIELHYPHPSIPVPDKFPYWNYAALWDAYHAACHSQAGFADPLPAYLAGSSFCRLPEITPRNLAKLVADHTQELRAGTYERDQASGFWGGYVLQVGGKAAFFPQCCGQLSDMVYWERLAQGQPSYYEGHPAPTVTLNGDSLVLDFSVGEFDEPFQPPPPPAVELSRAALQQAVAQAKQELQLFAQRLKEINAAAGLEIQDIDKLLIWSDGKHA